jgi:hypothetical protein
LLCFGLVGFLPVTVDDEEEIDNEEAEEIDDEEAEAQTIRLG